MRRGAREGNVQAFYRCDLDFHRSIWAISGNRYLARALDTTVVPLFAFFIMKTPPNSATDLVVSADRHADVVRALRCGDNARKCMETAMIFFGEQEQRLLFETPPNRGDA
jgi:DNA-binding GntR family transcriptional regulator